MRRTISYILFLFLLTLAPVGRVCADVTTVDGRVLTEEQLDSLRLTDDFVQVSLCVADPTDWKDDFMGVLGHAFIRLQCPVFGLDNCFSYECEPAKDNLWRFVKGDLKMGMFRYTTESQIEVFRQWDRTIREYRLYLPPVAKQRLWEIMDNHVNNGTKLPMDMYKRGCAISLVHFVKNALGNAKIEYHNWPEDFKKSRYELIYDAMDDYPWLQLGLFMVVDKRFDKPCSNEEKLVIPKQLAEVWQQATLDGMPFAEYIGNLTEGSDRVVEKTYFTPLVALIMLLLLIVGGIAWGVLRRRRKNP